MATRKLMVLTLIETVLMCEACHHSQYPIADVGLQEDERAQDSKRDTCSSTRNSYPASKHPDSNWTLPVLHCCNSIHPPAVE